MIIECCTYLLPYRMGVKYFNIQKNIRSFLSRRGHYIGRKTPSLHLLSRQGQNVFLPILRP